MGSARLLFAVALALVSAGALAAPADAAARSPERSCRPQTVGVDAGRTATLRLVCRVWARGRLRTVSRGRSGRLTIVRRPRQGRLGRLKAARGRVAFRPAGTARGADELRFRLRTADGRRYRGRVRLRIRPRSSTPAGPLGAPAPAPAAAPAPPAAGPSNEPATAGDGLPAPLPPVPASVASSTRRWTPAAQDTCSADVHDRFSVVGPDGKRYPTWHPPTWTDPRTGRTCTFGHEHGDDPRSSDLFERVAAHLAAPAFPDAGGLPFGVAAEALETYATAGEEPLPRRSEDHVGYKVYVMDDVPLVGEDGSTLGVQCDYLAMVHQGSHSGDALSNNVHELLYAVVCSDGTEVVSSTLSAFGPPGEFTRSCDEDQTVATVDNGYPDGGGRRAIPDRACVDRHVLVPPGRSTSPFALYENWSSENALRTDDPSAPPLAAFDTAFGVFDPSRYGAGGSPSAIGRTQDLCFERTDDGRRMSSVDCSRAGDGTWAFDDERAPFDGTSRDVFVGGTAVRGTGERRRWWTDPYGGNASPEPFPGAVCQLIGPANPATPTAARQVFKRGQDYDAPGVHAPN